MNNKVVATGAVALIVLVGAGIWILTTQNTSTPKDTANTSTQSSTSSELSQNDQSSAPSEKAGAVTITFSQNGFDKDSYTVKAGEPVTLTNTSSNTLEFASADHPTHRSNPELNLAPLSPGKSMSFTPSKTGTWHIHDHLDPNKTTTLVVE
jgi:plastocyanin